MLRYTIAFVGASIGLCALMPSAQLFLRLIPLVAVPHALSLANLPALVSRGATADKQEAALGINRVRLARKTLVPSRAKARATEPPIAPPAP